LPRPTCGVVEARSLTTSFDDPQTRFDSESCPRLTAEKPLFIVPLEGMEAQILLIHSLSAWLFLLVYCLASL